MRRTTPVVLRAPGLLLTASPLTGPETANSLDEMHHAIGPMLIHTHAPRFGSLPDAYCARQVQYGVLSLGGLQ